MVKITSISFALVASLAAFGEARNCTPKLDYCGRNLMRVGNYYSTVADELIRSQKSTCLKKDYVTDALFTCNGPNGEIRYKKFCKKGCKEGPSTGNDYCA